MALFGGVGADGLALSDTWLFRARRTPPSSQLQMVMYGASAAWTNPTTTLPSSGNPIPAARYGAGSASANGCLFVYGGRTSSFTSTLLSDLWKLDLNTNLWTQLSTGSATQPSRFGPVLWARWNPTSGAPVLGLAFGSGSVDGEVELPATSLFDTGSSTWTDVNLGDQQGAKSARALSAYLYNAATDKLYIQGGFNFSVSLPSQRIAHNVSAGIVWKGTVGFSASGPAPTTSYADFFGLHIDPVLPPERVDCVVSPWSDWSACMTDSTLRNGGVCRGQYKSHARTIITQPSGNGAECPPLFEVMPCSERPCLFDGQVRWAIMDPRIEVDSVNDMVVASSDSSSDSGYFFQAGGYDYTGATGIFPEPDVSLPMFVCNSANMTNGTDRDQSIRYKHSYLTLRSLDTGSAFTRTVASNGTGEDAALAVAMGPESSGMTRRFAIGGYFIGRLTFASYGPFNPSDLMTMGGVGGNETNSTFPSSPSVNITEVVSNGTTSDAYIAGFDGSLSFDESSQEPSLDVYPSWIATVSGQGAVQIVAVAYTTDGLGVIAAGNFDGNASFGGACRDLLNRDVMNRTGLLGSDSFVARYTASSGVCEWVVHVAGTGWQSITSMSLSNNTIAIAGASRGTNIEIATLGNGVQYAASLHSYTAGTVLTNPRIDGFVALISASNGKHIISGILPASSDTSTVTIASVAIASAWNSTTQSLLSTSITISGTYKKGLSWAWTSGTLIPQSVLATQTTSSPNFLDGFVARYVLRPANGLSLMWRSLITSPFVDMAAVSLDRAPSVANGTVHAIIVYGGGNGGNVTFNATMSGSRQETSILALPGRGGIQSSFSYVNGGVLASSVYGVSSKSNTSLIRIPVLVATDSLIIYSGSMFSNDTLLYAANASVKAASDMTALPGTNATGTRGNDVFAVGLTYLDPMIELPCVLSDWSEWSQCTRHCAGSFVTRTRSILQPAQNGGACFDPLIETKYSCGTLPCLGDNATWSVTIDTPFNDDIAAFIPSADSSRVYTLAGARTGNNTRAGAAAAGLRFYSHLLGSVNATSGVNVLNRTIANVSAQDGPTLSAPLSAAALGERPAGSVPSRFFVVGGTLESYLPFGAGPNSEFGMFGGAFAAVLDAANNNSFVASMHFGSQTDAGSRGFAVAYSPTHDASLLAGSYVSNLTVLVSDFNVSIPRAFYQMNYAPGSLSAAAVVAVVTPPVAGPAGAVNGISPAIAWVGSMTASSQYASVATGMAVRGDMLYVVGFAMRSETGTGISFGGYPLFLDLSSREYLWAAVVNLTATQVVWARTLLDVGPMLAQLQDIGPLRAGGSTASVAVGDDGRIFVTTSYRSSTVVMFGSASMHCDTVDYGMCTGYLPPCDLYTGGSCGALLVVDATYGYGLGATAITPSGDVTRDGVKVTGVSTGGGMVAVTGTFSSDTISISPVHYARLNSTIDSFVALYKGDSAATTSGPLGFWTSRSSNAVSSPTALLTPSGSTLYLTASTALVNATNSSSRSASAVRLVAPGLQCHSSCGSCSGGGFRECSSCRIGMFLLNNTSTGYSSTGATCVEACPDGFYAREDTGTCEVCDSACNTCTGATSRECSSCKLGNNSTSSQLFFVDRCVSDCTATNPDFVNCYNSSMCIAAPAEAMAAPGALCACHSSCYTCSGPSVDQCLTCPAPNLLFFNSTSQAKRCVTPLDCYYGGGYSAVNNETGQMICLPYLCPSLPIENTTVIVDFSYNVSAGACLPLPSATPSTSPTPSGSPSPSPSVTATETATGTVTPTLTPIVSLAPGVSPSNTASRSITATATVTASLTPSPSVTASSSITPDATFPIPCVLASSWGAWSSTCAQSCAAAWASGALTTSSIYRTRAVIAPARNNGTCPDGISPDRLEVQQCACPSASRTPLPSPVSTCFNGIKDGLETDVDCGGNGGCPRCAAGRACKKTLDCTGDASNATLAFLSRYNYTGQAFICNSVASTAAGASTAAAAAAASGVCTDARLSLSVYGVNATVVPRFVQFKFSLGGLPVTAPVSAVLEYIRYALLSSFNRTDRVLASLLSKDDIIVAGVTAPVTAVSPTPTSSPSRGASPSASAAASASTSATASASTSASPAASLAGNGTATPSPSVAAASVTPFPCINGTLNGTASNCTLDQSNSTNSSISSNSSNSSNLESGNITCVNGTYTENNVTYYNCSSSSANTTRRMLKEETNAAVEEELKLIARTFPSLSLSTARALRSVFRRLAETFSLSLDIRVILPDDVNTTTTLQTLSSDPASFTASVASAVSASLLAANYTTDPVSLSVDLLSASGNETSSSNTTGSTFFYVVAPLDALVEKTDTVVPPVTPAADAAGGGGGAAGAAAAIIILLVVFFGIAFYFVRSSGSFLGCTFGPLADCFGKWPLSPTAQANRSALQHRGLWMEPRKVISTSSDPTAQAVNMDQLKGNPKQVVNPLASVQQQQSSMNMLLGMHSQHSSMSHMNLNMGMQQQQHQQQQQQQNRMEFSPTGMMTGGGMMMGGGMPNQQRNPMAAAATMNNAYPATPTFGNPLMAAMSAQQMSAQYGQDAMQLHKSAARIQALYRGHRVRKMTATERIAASAGKAALKATSAASAQAANAVSHAASSLAKTELASRNAAAASAMTKGKNGKRRNQMSDLEAALLLQRIYKGYKLRQALRGWVKVVDDDGDVFYKNEATGMLEWVLPSMPFGPPPEEAAEGEGEEAAEEGEVDYEVDEDGNTWHLDGPGGHRLAWGWRRCEDGEDVWYVNDEDPDAGSSWEPIYAED